MKKILLALIVLSASRAEALKSIQGQDIDPASNFTFNAVTAGSFTGDGSGLTGVSASFNGGTVTNQTTIQSTLTVQGNSFSVGGSTFNVDGGIVSIGFGASTRAYLGGGIGFIPYTQATTTTTVTGSSNTVVFATMTVLANTITRPGQILILRCDYQIAKLAQTADLVTQFNSGGVFTRLTSSSTIAGTTNGRYPTGISVEMTFLSHQLWTVTTKTLGSPSSIAGGGSGSVFNILGQTFDETTDLTFNCGCRNTASSVATGLCSFVGMRMDIDGM